jgi:hypothetical protein
VEVSTAPMASAVRVAAVSGVPADAAIPSGRAEGRLAQCQTSRVREMTAAASQLTDAAIGATALITIERAATRMATDRISDSPP